MPDRKRNKGKISSMPEKKKRRAAQRQKRRKTLPEKYPYLRLMTQESLCRQNVFLIKKVYHIGEKYTIQELLRFFTVIDCRRVWKKCYNEMDLPERFGCG